MYTSEQKENRHWFWLLAYTVLALIVYWPARDAGFVTDWLGGQEVYENGTYWQALNSFGWRALIPVLFVINFTLFKIFGTWWLPWFLIFTGTHALNAWQLQRLTLRLPGLEGRAISMAAVAGALLFLLSPYAAEPVVWKGCIQYQLSLLCVLTAMLHCLRYFQQPVLRHVLWVSALFLAGIFMYGWNVVAPVLLTGFIVAYTWAQGEWSQLAQRLRWMAAPVWAGLAGWFALNKFYLGQWVGHYGAGTHMQFDPKVMVATGMKYVAKYALFARYFEPADKSRVFDWFDKPAVVWASIVLTGLLFGLWLWFFRRLSARLRWAGFYAWAFAVALIPVANLFFYYLQWSENDRYGYMGSAFFWMAVCLLLAGLPRWLFAGLSAALLVVSIHFQWTMTRTWGQAEQIYDSLVQDFRWYDREEVIILASPDNLKGVSVLRIIGQQSGFDEALALRRREPYRGEMWEVAQFNMETPDDGVKVQVDSSGMEYTLDFRQYGNWWFRNSVGAENYQTDRYLFRKNEWNVQTILKSPRKSGTVLIYPVGGKWLEVGDNK